MLFRFSVSIILLLSTLTIVFAKDYDFLLPSNKTINEVKRKFSSLNQSNIDTSDFEKFVNKGFNVEMFKGLSSLKKDWWLRVYKEKERRRKKVIFYLFSSSVPENSVKNVFSQVKFVPKDVKFFPVLRGIPSIEYLEKMKEWKDMIGIRVKVNPLIFRGVGAEVVPAFVLADCEIVARVLRSKTCVYKKVLYGDVSLKFALEKLLEK